ncbi:ribosomal protection-like ABC-F family protein [Listeria aquatica]|uniref:ribosomal protection-like ABC-F family protein n=1 Tax=Listeria aquatica TaxID=1494960 RepID=UPI003EF91227
MFSIEIHDLTMEIGARNLFVIPELRVKPNAKIGIIGQNGTGKTTLLEILTGEREATTGSVERSGTVGMIKQIPAEIERLSGGEKTRKEVQRVLQERPAILFADEPTSNLDVASTKHVIRDFKRFSGTLLIISHDRDFLDAVVDEIWELDQEEITVYKGNYSDYAAKKKKQREQKQKAYDENVAEKRKLQAAMAHRKQIAESMETSQSKLFKKGMSRKEIAYGNMYKGTQQKSQHKTIKATQKRLERLPDVDKPFISKSVKITLPESRKLKPETTLIQVQKGEIGFPEKKLFEIEPFSIKIGDKMALVGQNASGKTTFLKRLLNDEAPIRILGSTRIAYFDQGLQGLDVDKTMLENIDQVNAHDKQMAMDVLGSLHFQQADLKKSVSVLSGGERVKLYLAMILLSDANFLVLDEPTNYLDITALEALEGLISTFEGAVLFVSHDTAFVRNTALEVLQIEKGKMKLERKSMQRVAAEKESADQVVEEDSLLVELRLSEIAAKLGDPKLSAAEKASLDQAYLENSRKLRELKGN